MGAALTNVAARSDDPCAPEVASTWRRAFLVTISAATVIAMAVIIATQKELWALLLPSAQNAFPVNTAIGALITMVVFNAPLGLVHRWLLGAGRIQSSVLISGISALALPAFIHAVFLLQLPIWLIGIAPAAVLTLSNVAASLWMIHVTRGTMIRRLLHRRLPERGPSILATGIPMLLITVAQPLALQSDRIILERRSTLEEVAAYGICYLFYAPSMAILSSMALSLWPKFQKVNNLGSLHFGEFRHAWLAHSGLTLGAGLAICAGFPVAAWYFSSAPISLSVFLAFAFLCVAQGLTQPFAMLFSDARGLRIQAALLFPLAFTNLILSWFSAPHLGAIGVLISSAFTIMAFQLSPLWFIYHRHRPKGA